MVTATPSAAPTVAAANASCPGVGSLTLDAVGISDLVLIFFLFQGLGVTIHFDQYKEHFRKPRGVLVAVAVQFFLMPAIGYGMALSFATPANVPFAVGLIVQTCSPGGALSNMLAILFRMDVSLSLAMTTLSSILAMGMMPLNLFIYLRATHLTGDATCLQTSGIFVAAAVVVAGVGCGLAIRTRLPMRWLNLAVTLGGLAGIGVLVVTIAFNVQGNYPVWSTPPKVAALTIVSPIVAMTLGAGLTAALRRPRLDVITVAVETGMPNKVLASAVLAVIFTDPNSRDQAFAIPFLYGVFSAVETVVWSLVVWKLGWTRLNPRAYLWSGLFETYREMKLLKEGRADEIPDFHAGAGADAVADASANAGAGESKAGGGWFGRSNVATSGKVVDAADVPDAVPVPGGSAAASAARNGPAQPPASSSSRRGIDV